MRKVLNVGAGSRGIKMPQYYDDWEQVYLDLSPTSHPDIVADVRDLFGLPACEFDAVYASHILEHVMDHEVPLALRGMRHVIKAEGFAEIKVPDVLKVIQLVAQEGRDLDWVLYHSGTGPIAVADVLWGSRRHQLYSGNDYHTHRTGFSAHLLSVALGLTGWPLVFMQELKFEIRALAFLSQPSTELAEALGVEYDES